MTSEAQTQQLIRLAAVDKGCTLWRNNSGAFSDDTGRVIRYGLGNDSKKVNAVWKSSDLIGITPVRITPDHVGRTLGVFTAVEVKNPDWSGIKTDRETAQARFHQTVQEYHGIAGFARDVLDYQLLTDVS